MIRMLLLIWVVAPSIGCAASTADERDGAFLGPGGKADGLDITDGDPEALGVLRLVNEATYELLLEDVGLTSRAASGIIEHRAGQDGELGTDDDAAFEVLAELDDVPYIGPISFAKLLDYAVAHGYVETPSNDTPCAAMGSGETPIGDVPTCEALHPERPFIRPPADELTEGHGVVYVGTLALGGSRFEAVDRNGVEYLLLDEAGTEMTFVSSPDPLRPPRNLFTIYRVEGTVTTADGLWGPQPAIRAESVTPALYVPGHVIDGAFAGAWRPKCHGASARGATMRRARFAFG